MFETLKNLWANRTTNGITETMLTNAVTKGWITTDLKIEIMAQ